MRDSNPELGVASPWEQVKYCTSQTIPVKVAAFASGIFTEATSSGSVSAEKSRFH
jgi:hypothetical protein